ncbi:MAG: site-specific DNA-methyltransferase, partial [Candidatus Micrarchaeota archaeon]|nr:site-specific DNA-methyltransferase [Candidatus Micrarchaeota archaeon]
YRDNIGKPVYGWYPYKEGFSWRLVDRCLELASRKIDVGSIGDPFMGSGTTLLRAKELGFRSYGVDVSPFAYVLTKAKVSDWNFSQRDIEEVRELDLDRIDGEVDVWFELFPLNRAFSDMNYRALRKLRYWVENRTEVHLIALIRAAMESSYVYKDGGVLKIRKSKKPYILHLFKKYLIRMMGETVKGPIPEIELGSAFSFSRHVDVIITSPPYLNNIDYTKVYGIELALTTLGRDWRDIRGRMMTSFIRSKVTGESMLPVKQRYLEESYDLFQRFYRILNGGVLFYNVSNSVVNGIHYEIDRELMGLMENAGFREVRIVDSIVRKTVIDGKMYRVRESLIMASS